MCLVLPNTSTESNSGLAISEDAVPASSAAGSGYAEAKWLAEEMIMEVSRRTGMPATIVRLGQVCGDKLGHWNEKEWFSAMVKSSLITGTLPDHDIVGVFHTSRPHLLTPCGYPDSCLHPELFGR